MARVTRPFRLSALLLLLFSAAGCQGETAAPTISDTSPPVITPTNYKITFPGVSYADVLFDHQHHTTSPNHGIDNDCYRCHNCSDFFRDSLWNCRDCHSPKNPEGLCRQADQLHGCIMVQCSDCHEKERLAGRNPPKSSECILCHTAGLLPVVTLTGTIGSRTQVDTHIFALDFASPTATVILDVEAHEGCGGAYAKWPSDFFDDGESNNGLLGNIYFFRSDNSYLGSAVGLEPGLGWTEGYPHSQRSAYNGWIKVTGLTPGSYKVAIGAALLSRANALLGSNSQGATWYTNDPDNYKNPTSKNHYRIKVYTRFN